MAHVGQELALVLGGQRELFGLLLELLLGQLDFTVLDLNSASSEVLAVAALTSRSSFARRSRVLLLPQQLFGLLERGRLMLQLRVLLAEDLR